MMPLRILGATNYLGAPPGWEPAEDGACAPLAVRHVGNIYESAWEPTPDELAALNAGGSVVLRVVGSQPPVALYVEPSKEPA
jgi:hypothetical protein